jgi:hypothetical protein
VLELAAEKSRPLKQAGAVYRDGELIAERLQQHPFALVRHLIFRCVQREQPDHLVRRLER